MEKEMLQFRFAKEDASLVDTIIKETAELTAASAYKQFGGKGVIEEVTVSDYSEKNEKVKESILSFAAQRAGIDTPQDTRDMRYALDNAVFRNILNTIVARTLDTTLSTYESPTLNRLVEIVPVEVGASFTFEIDTKAIPVPQRGAYGTNVTLVPSYAKSGITLSPKQYGAGTSLDFIRIIANGYDFGKAIARIYAGIIAAQYKLATSKLFSTTILNGTPFYQENFNSQKFVQMADDLSMLNGTSIDDVTAYGTRVAWNAISALATQGGFVTRDEYIKSGYLNKIYGVDGVVLEQMGTFNKPFTNANAEDMRDIPNDLIILVSSTDKVVKMVRENYVRVIETPANENTLNRNEYSFFVGFDAAPATSSFWALQGVTQG